MKNKPIVCLTYGEPAGIGPEILSKTLKSWKFKLKPIVFGKTSSFVLGKPTKSSGLYAYNSLREAVSFVKKNTKSVLVTGPVSKYTINLAIKDFSGQTDEIAKWCNISPDDVIMLFVANDLRIALFTRHISLKTVPSKITRNSLQNFIFLLNKELKKWFHIKNPKIGILGLNPHASEKGLFGSEEDKIISPVIKRLSKSGLKVYGPLSPDATLAKSGQDFTKKKKQSYDVLVSLYHDQALPMFKAIAGMKGTNVTLGLPFLRVSVDHGTAFDIAGKNKASNESLISAIKLVEKLSMSYQS